MEALGDQEAAKEKKDRQAEEVKVEGVVIQVLCFSGKEMRMYFHHHQGGYEPDQSEVIPARILQMISQSAFGV